MNLTKAEAAQLGRRALQPTRGPGEILAVFVPGKLRNLTNQRWGWKGDMAYKRRWREKVAQAILEARWRPASKGLNGAHTVFLAHVWNPFDGDGLQAALKPVRDELVSCRVLADDKEVTTGNSFEYQQVTDRKCPGVEVRVIAPGQVPAAATPPHRE